MGCGASNPKVYVADELVNRIMDLESNEKKLREEIAQLKAQAQAENQRKNQQSNVSSQQQQQSKTSNAELEDVTGEKSQEKGEMNVEEVKKKKEEDVNENKNEKNEKKNENGEIYKTVIDGSGKMESDGNKETGEELITDKKEEDEKEKEKEMEDDEKVKEKEEKEKEEKKKTVVEIEKVKEEKEEVKKKKKKEGPSSSGRDDSQKNNNNNENKKENVLNDGNDEKVKKERKGKDKKEKEKQVDQGGNKKERKIKNKRDLSPIKRPKRKEEKEKKEKKIKGGEKKESSPKSPIKKKKKNTDKKRGGSSSGRRGDSSSGSGRRKKKKKEVDEKKKYPYKLTPEMLQKLEKNKKKKQVNRKKEENRCLAFQENFLFPCSKIKSTIWTKEETPSNYVLDRFYDTDGALWMLRRSGIRKNGIVARTEPFGKLLGINKTPDYLPRTNVKKSVWISYPNEESFLKIGKRFKHYPALKKEINGIYWVLHESEENAPPNEICFECRIKSWDEILGGPKIPPLPKRKTGNIWVVFASYEGYCFLNYLSAVLTEEEINGKVREVHWVCFKDKDSIPSGEAAIKSRDYSWAEKFGYHGKNKKRNISFLPKRNNGAVWSCYPLKEKVPRDLIYYEELSGTQKDGLFWVCLPGKEFVEEGEIGFTVNVKNE